MKSILSRRNKNLQRNDMKSYLISLDETLKTTAFTTYYIYYILKTLGVMVHKSIKPPL